ncbi:hypothetical protein LDO32_07390 [Luteimonas sp. Y-2-2-4F]|nr:hypothetical protein [Luteimonas sp. Y-2-2-4F]
MSQNIPPNPPEQPDPADQPYESNPYQAGRRQTVPDLDAEAPTLRSEDVQRLNRKALLFLAGIVVLLVLGAIWLFGSALSGGDEDQGRRSRGEQVVIPEAPRDVALPELPPVAEPMPQPELPPLPVVQDEPPPASRSSLPSTDMFSSRELSLLQRRMQDVAGGSFGQQGPGGMMSPDEYSRRMAELSSGAGAGEGAQQLSSRDAPTSARPIYNPDTLMVRGTYIRCVLETRVITDIPGFTSCVVTEPVYSINGRRLLLPKGSKVSGTYGNDGAYGNRVAVVWDRVTTPNGLDVSMSSPGVDNLGSAGHPGHYDAHWPERITSALLISLVSDAFKYLGAEYGPQRNEIGEGGIVVQNPYESNTARTMERIANMAVDDAMRRRPTVTINQGTVVNVYVARDVDFSGVLR